MTLKSLGDFFKGGNPSLDVSGLKILLAVSRQALALPSFLNDCPPLPVVLLFSTDHTQDRGTQV
jgi:hypothetical protein